MSVARLEDVSVRCVGDDAVGCCHLDLTGAIAIYWMTWGNNSVNNHYNNNNNNTSGSRNAIVESPVIVGACAHLVLECGTARCGGLASTQVPGGRTRRMGGDSNAVVYLQKHKSCVASHASEGTLVSTWCI